MPEPTFNPEAMLTTLERHSVHYVLIGGLAATFYGSPHVTTDVDITPSTTVTNLAKLAAALVDLDARLRVENEPDGVRPECGRPAHEHRRPADNGRRNRPGQPGAAPGDRHLAAAAGRRRNASASCPPPQRPST